MTVPTRRPFVALGMLAYIVAMAPAANGTAGSLTAALEWTSPAASNCPTVDAMKHAVELRLARPVFVDSTNADVSLRVVIERIGSRWKAQLELLDSAHSTLGTRTLQSASSDCAALTDVLPVVLALLLDASRQHVQLELPQPSYSAPATTSPSVRMHSLESTHMQQTLEPKQPPMAYGWSASATVAYGLLPGAAPGARLTGFADLASIPLELSLGVLGSTDDTSKVRLWLFEFDGGLCPTLERGTLHWGACVGVGLGRLQAVGRGFDVDLSEHCAYADLRASTRLDLPIARPWFARIEAGAVFPLTRPQFVGENQPQVRNPLHRPLWIAPQAAVGIGIGFL